MRVSDWLERYTAEQAKQLADAHQKYLVEGISDRELVKNNMFVKVEVRNHAWGAESKEVKPRAIIPCVPKIKPVVGTFMVAFAEHLHREWNCYDSPIFFECGASTDDIAYWFNTNLERFGPDALFEADETGFDATQSPTSLRFCNDIYEACGAHGDVLRCLRAQERDQYIRARDGTRAKRPAFMKSGVPNTTVGNSLVNAAMFYYAFVKAGAKPFEDFMIMVRGDDMLSFLKPQFHDKVEATIRALGFEPKIKRTHDVPHARFCSMAFYPTIHDGKKWYVPAPTIKCLTKLGATARPLPKREDSWKQHMRGVALGLLALTNHVPLLSDYVQKVLAVTTGAEGKLLREALRDIRKKYPQASRHEPLPESDSFLAEMYNLTLGDVDTLRRTIAGMEVPGVYQTGNSAFLIAKCLGIEDG